MAFCSKCGYQMAETARFCKACGSEENPPRPQETPSAPQETAAAQQPQYIPEPTPASQYAPTPQYIPEPTPAPQYAPAPQYVPAPSSAAPVAAAAAKASSSILTKIICFGLIAAVLIVAANHFKLWNLFKSDEDLIRERFQIMQDCYNDGDLEGYLGCMDSTSRAAAQMMLDMAGGLMSDYIGFDMDFGDMMSFGSALAGGDMLQIEVHEVRVEGKEGYAVTTFRLEFYGEVQEETMEFPMIKEGNEWFINGQVADAINELMGMINE